MTQTTITRLSFINLWFHRLENFAERSLAQPEFVDLKYSDKITHKSDVTLYFTNCCVHFVHNSRFHEENFQILQYSLEAASVLAVVAPKCSGNIGGLASRWQIIILVRLIKKGCAPIRELQRSFYYDSCVVPAALLGAVCVERFWTYIQQLRNSSTFTTQPRLQYVHHYRNQASQKKVLLA